jgi:hypothetical protein
MFLARSINRILEVDRKRSKRWWGISTKSRRYSIARGSRCAFGHLLAHSSKGGGKVPGGSNGQAGMHPDHGVEMPETSVPSRFYSAAWAAGEVKRPLVSCVRMKSRTLGRICSRQRRPLKMP